LENIILEVLLGKSSRVAFGKVPNFDLTWFSVFNYENKLLKTKIKRVSAVQIKWMTFHLVLMLLLIICKKH